MIKKQKKRLFNFILLLIFPFLAAFSISLNLHPHPYQPIVILYAIATIIFLLLIKIQNQTRNSLLLKKQDFSERINILDAQLKSDNIKLNALEEKISNYRSLEKLIGELNSSLSLDKTINTPIDWVFMLVAQKQGTAILYLMDNRKQKLEIFTTRKEDSRVVIKTKEGDIFDQWVLRHNTDLLVEDTKKDFRFDLEKIAQDEFRSLGSIISAPLISGSNFLGILRLENFSAGKFNLDDLRLLRNIADLGAVAVENASLYQHTEELAIKDGLTGLYLRNYLSERMEEELKRAQKTNQPISFLMIDIDHFKIYNDKFGHIAGDIVLKNIAKTLKESFEPKDNIASRVGGEEFGLLLIGKDKKEAKKIAEELRKKIHSEKLILRRKETSITVSIGVASFPIDASSKEDLINQADTALYKAKKSGRNCVCSI